MNTLTLLFKRNGRKSLGLLFVTMLLSVIMVSLLTLGQVAAREFPTAFDQQAADLNAEDVQFYSTVAGVSDLLVSELEKNDDVAEVEASPALAEAGTLTYAGSDLNLALLYVDASVQTSLGQSTLEPELGSAESGAYLPLMYHVAGGYSVGDTVKVSLIGGKSRTFNVAGFYENTIWSMVGSGVIGVPLTHDVYESLAADVNPPVATAVVRADVVAGADVEPVYHEATQAAQQAFLAQKGYVPPIGVNTIDLVRWAVLSSGLVYSVLLQSVGWVIAVVVMLVIAALVRNGIARDLPAIGIQKAVGITSRSVMASIVIPPILAALVGIGIGTALGYGAMPWLAGQLESISGLTWKPTFDLTAFLTASSVAIGGVLLAGLLSAWRVVRIRPVSALGSGTTTHTFSRSPIKLRKARLPVNALLGIQQWLHSKGQAVAVTLVMVAVSFAAVFSTVLGAGVLGSKDALQNVLVGQLADVTAYIAPGVDPAKALRAAEELDGVASVIGTDWIATEVEGRTISAQITENFADIKTAPLWQGREPEADNEIAMSAMAARDKGLELGDQVTIEIGDADESYLVTGIFSTVQNSGYRIDMTTDGYHRLVPDAELAMLNIYTVGRSDDLAESVTDTLESDYAQYFSRVSNTRGETDSVLESYVNLCRSLGVVVLVITGAVIALVLTVLVSAMIVGNEKSYGVRKGLGFTTANLITQTLWAYLPSVLIGVGAGLALGLWATLPLLSSFMSGLGIANVNVPLDVQSMVAVAIGLVVLSGVLVALNALRLRKLSAYKLITE